MLDAVEGLVDFGTIAADEEGNVHGGSRNKGLLKVVPVGKYDAGGSWGKFVVGGVLEDILGVVNEWGGNGEFFPLDDVDFALWPAGG